MDLNVSIEEVKRHLFKFHGSLAQYPSVYFPLVFRPMSIVPAHLVYLCPLCLKEFLCHTDSRVRYSTSFSLDHFPPQNVGGVQKILVCKKCNNTAGLSFESVLVDLLNQQQYNRRIPNIEVRTKSVLSEIKGWHHGALSFDKEGKMHFRMTAKDSAKRIPKLDYWQESTNNGGEGWKMEITVKNLDETKIIKALLKTAYLYCFNYWGYEFVLSRAGELIRKVLTGEAEYPVKLPNIWFDNKTAVHDGVVIPTGLVFLSSPQNLQSIFVNIPLSLGEYYAVVPIQIPHPTDKDFSYLKKIQDILDKSNGTIINFTQINFQFDLKVYKPYTRSWEELLEKYNEEITS